MNDVLIILKSEVSQLHNIIIFKRNTFVNDIKKII